MSSPSECLKEAQAAPLARQERTLPATERVFLGARARRRPNFAPAGAGGDRSNLDLVVREKYKGVRNHLTRAFGSRGESLFVLEGLRELLQLDPGHPEFRSASAPCGHGRLHLAEHLFRAGGLETEVGHR